MRPDAGLGALGGRFREPHRPLPASPLLAALPRRPAPGDPVSETIRVMPLPDPVIDTLGHDPRAPYPERFWLQQIEL